MKTVFHREKVKKKWNPGGGWDGGTIQAWEDLGLCVGGLGGIRWCYGFFSHRGGIWGSV